MQPRIGTVRDPYLVAPAQVGRLSTDAMRAAVDGRSCKRPTAPAGLRASARKTLSCRAMA